MGIKSYQRKTGIVMCHRLHDTLVALDSVLTLTLRKKEQRMT